MTHILDICSFFKKRNAKYIKRLKGQGFHNNERKKTIKYFNRY